MWLSSPIKQDELGHSARRAFENCNTKTRLRRLSLMQFDRDIREEFGLEHKKFEIFQEPTFCPKLPSNLKINTNLIEPCNKAEFVNVIREIGLKTIEKLKKKKDFLHAYTDGSLDKTFTNEGSGVLLTAPNGTTH